MLLGSDNRRLGCGCPLDRGRTITLNAVPEWLYPPPGGCRATPGGYLAAWKLPKYSYVTCTFVILTKHGAALPSRMGRPQRPLGVRVPHPPHGRGQRFFDNPWAS